MIIRSLIDAKFPDDIKRFNLFTHLNQEELQEIASHLIYKRFTKGADAPRPLTKILTL